LFGNRKRIFNVWKVEVWLLRRSRDKKRRPRENRRRGAPKDDQSCVRMKPYRATNGQVTSSIWCAVRAHVTKLSWDKSTVVETSADFVDEDRWSESAEKIEITSKVRNEVSLVRDDPRSEKRQIHSFSNCDEVGWKEEEDRKGKEGNGYKDAISVVWSIAITSVPSFQWSVTRSPGNHNPKTLLRSGDGWAAG